LRAKQGKVFANKSELTAFLIADVRTRSVGMALTQEEEHFLRSIGATDELIVAIISHSANPLAVKKFSFVYTPADPSSKQGQHTVRVQNETTWIDELSKTPTTWSWQLRIRGRIKVEDDPGTLLDNLENVENRFPYDGAHLREYFVPDKGGKRMYIRSRLKATDAWTLIGKMENIE
jgi:hypothetical protein